MLRLRFDGQLEIQGENIIGPLTSSFQDAPRPRLVSAQNNSMFAPPRRVSPNQPPAFCFFISSPPPHPFAGVRGDPLDVSTAVSERCMHAARPPCLGVDQRKHCFTVCGRRPTPRAPSALGGNSAMYTYTYRRETCCAAGSLVCVGASRGSRNDATEPLERTKNKVSGRGLPGFLRSGRPAGHTRVSGPRALLPCCLRSVLRSKPIRHDRSTRCPLPSLLPTLDNVRPSPSSPPLQLQQSKRSEGSEAEK